MILETFVMVLMFIVVTLILLLVIRHLDVKHLQHENKILSNVLDELEKSTYVKLKQNNDGNDQPILSLQNSGVGYGLNIDDDLDTDLIPYLQYESSYKKYIKEMMMPEYLVVHFVINNAPGSDEPELQKKVDELFGKWKQEVYDEYLDENAEYIYIQQKIEQEDWY